MDGIMSAIAEMTTAGQLIASGLLTLVLMGAGIGIMFSGNRGMDEFKAKLPAILVGTALCFGALQIGMFLISVFHG